MENIFKYYNFSSFFKDTSNSFSENEICFSKLNDTHFLIFERQEEGYHLYVSKYKNEKEVGVKSPEIIEILIKNYDKSNPQHRIALRKYLE